MPWTFYNACKNFGVQHRIEGKIWFFEKVDLVVTGPKFIYPYPFRRHWCSKWKRVQNRAKFSMFLAPHFLGGPPNFDIKLSLSGRLKTSAVKYKPTGKLPFLGELKSAIVTSCKKYGKYSGEFGLLMVSETLKKWQKTRTDKNHTHTHTHRQFW